MSTTIDTKGQAETPDSPSEYTKAIIAAVGSALVVILLALSSGDTVKPLVIINAILAAVTVIPVWRFSQKWWLKAISAGVLAALQLLATILSPTLGWGDVNTINWASVILAFVTAAGVGIIPNQQAKIATIGSMTINSATTEAAHRAAA